MMRKGMMITSFCASLSPNLVDLSSDDFIGQTDKPLMVAASASLEREIQQRLVRFLHAGGKLLLAPLVPTLDENFNRCTILADYIGGVEQSPHPSMAPLLTAFGVRNIFANGALFATTRRPPDAHPTAVESRHGPVEIGWRRTLNGGGIVSVLGLHWKHSKREHEAMLKEALAELGLQPVVRCDNPNIWTTLRSDGRQSVLFMLNLLTSPLSANVSYRDPASGKWINTGAHEIPGISVWAWKDGRTIHPRA